MCRRAVLYHILNGRYDRKSAVCLLMCELLSPEGVHDKGLLFLKPFVRDVLNLNIPEQELSDAKVYRSYNNAEDIAIKAGQELISFKLYFSLYETRPSLGNIYIHSHSGECISSAVEIMNWIQQCTRQPEVLNDSEIFDVLVRFRRMIDIIEYGIEYPVMRVPEYDAEYILSSPANFKTAGETMKYAINELRERIFCETCRKAGRKGTDGRMRIDSEGYITILQDGEWLKCALPDGSFPNFNVFNDALYSLCSERIFDDFTDQCAEKLIMTFRPLLWRTYKRRKQNE